MTVAPRLPDSPHTESSVGHGVTQEVPRADYLGSGRVLFADVGGVQVRLDDGRERPARMALAFPYRPVVGDSLLVIAREDSAFVIGVLDGSGQTSLELAGDVDLRARGGKLSLTGDRGLELRGPAIDIVGDAMRVVVESMSETATSVFQRVRETISVHAGEVRSWVKGDSHQVAHRMSLKTEDTVTINGREVHLG